MVGLQCFRCTTGDSVHIAFIYFKCSGLSEKKKSYESNHELIFHAKRPMLKQED